MRRARSTRSFPACAPRVWPNSQPAVVGREGEGEGEGGTLTERQRATHRDRDRDRDRGRDSCSFCSESAEPPASRRGERGAGGPERAQGDAGGLGRQGRERLPDVRDPLSRPGPPRAVRHDPPLPLLLQEETQAVLGPGPGQHGQGDGGSAVPLSGARARVFKVWVAGCGRGKKGSKGVSEREREEGGRENVRKSRRKKERWARERERERSLDALIELIER
eukprot:1352051-Rhodomonas_salina.1